MPLHSAHRAALSPAMVVRWLLCPALFALACWLLLLNPHLIHHHLPHPHSPWLLGTPPQHQDRGRPFPLSLSTLAAWQLGRTLGQLEGGAVEEELLRQAAALLQVPRGTLDKAQLLAVGTGLTQQEGAATASARILGVLKVVNVLWVVAIGGITISVLPALRMLLGPLIQVLIDHILVPGARLLLRALQALQPVWEASAYLVILYIIAAAERYPPSAAAYIALSGCLLYIPAFAYSTNRHLQKEGAPPALSLMANASAALVMAPVAVKYSSSLVGFFASAALFGALGFSVLPLGLCYVIGFQGNTMYRAGATSFLVLVLLSAVKAAGLEVEYLGPFRLGLATFGSISFFLAGLILSSQFHSSSQREYMTVNVVYALLLLGAITAGAVLQIDAMFNTGLTFLALWCSEKIVEHLVDKYAWPVIFLSSVALWQLALFLHNHPQWVYSLFNI